MTKRDFVKERCDRAIEAFKNHELVDNREDRWRIAKRYPDGKIDCVHAAEIVSLWGGRIYVGGDIDDCVFAYYSSSGKGETPREQHIAKLRWMGCHTDVSYYVRQKASLGLTDGGKLVDEFDVQTAENDLDYRLQQELERVQENAATDEEREDDEKRVRSIFEHAKELVHDDPHVLRTYLYNELHDGDAWEWLAELGMIVSHRVIYAWAALRRLCELLDAQEKRNEQKTAAESR